MPQANVYVYATGAAAMSETLERSDRDIELVAVLLHLSAVGGASEDFKVYIDADEAANVYDVSLLEVDMNAVDDVVFMPDQPLPIKAGDVLTCTYTNTNTKTWGLTIIYRNLGHAAP